MENLSLRSLSLDNTFWRLNLLFLGSVWWSIYFVYVHIFKTKSNFDEFFVVNFGLFCRIYLDGQCWFFTLFVVTWSGINDALYRHILGRFPMQVIWYLFVQIFKQILCRQIFNNRKKWATIIRAQKCTPKFFYAKFFAPKSFFYANTFLRQKIHFFMGKSFFTPHLFAK